MSYGVPSFIPYSWSFVTGDLYYEFKGTQETDCPWSSYSTSCCNGIQFESGLDKWHVALLSCSYLLVIYCCSLFWDYRLFPYTFNIDLKNRFHVLFDALSSWYMVCKYQRTK
jgi:hypothetical protein